MKLQVDEYLIISPQFELVPKKSIKLFLSHIKYLVCIAALHERREIDLDGVIGVILIVPRGRDALIQLAEEDLVAVGRVGQQRVEEGAVGGGTVAWKISEEICLLDF